MKIKKKNILYYLSFFLITNNIMYDIVAFKYIRAFLLISLVGYYCLFNTSKNNRKCIMQCNPFIFLFLIAELASTLINGTDIISFVGSSLTIVLIWLLAVRQTKDTLEPFLTCLYRFSISYLFINAIIMIIAPGGLSSFSNEWGWTSNLYLSGQTLNMFLLLIIPYITANIISNAFSKKTFLRLNSIIYGIYIILYLFWINKHETTAGFVCIVLLISNLISLKRKEHFIIPTWCMILFFVVTTIGIVFSDTLLSTSVVKFFVESVLHKTISFTGRTEIWRKAILCFLERPILGYGVGAQVVRFIQDVGVNEHNQILHILIEGGVVSLFVFILSVLYLFLCIHKIHNISIRNACTISLLCSYLLFFTTAFGLAAIWEFFFLLTITALITSKRIGICL